METPNNGSTQPATPDTSSLAHSGSSTPRSDIEFPFPFVPVEATTTPKDEYILVTGGLGYIGSHTTLELLKAGYNVVLIDNLSNSYICVLDRIRLLVQQHYSNHSEEIHVPILEFHRIDYGDVGALRGVLDQYQTANRKSWVGSDGPKYSKIIGVIHFAAYKSPTESIRMPLPYYSNNLACFVGLLKTLGDYGIKTFVFSSSATVYGAIMNESNEPIKEEHCVHEDELFTDGDGRIKLTQQGCRGLTSPYGRTKWMCEAILSDLSISDPDWTVVALRYFNPVGCDPSGLLGEDPLGLPNNLMPVVCKVLRGELPVLKIYGTDYNTNDGTGVRDFIHVTDLAMGHLAAIAAAATGLYTRFRSFNLGSGLGHSVLELVEAMEQVSTREIKLQLTDRRSGDVAISIAQPTRAEKELNWRTQRSLLDSCRDSWNFLTRNPLGYRNPES